MSENIRLPDSWQVNWVLERPLGKGAFASVYRAVRRDEPSIDAAIKIISLPPNQAALQSLVQDEGLNPDRAQTYFDDVAREYTNEIKLMDAFKGMQHIVSIEDFFVRRKQDMPGNDIFIRMELLTPLDAIIKQRMLTEREVLQMGRDIADALEICAANGILHRDIKPANIFVNNRVAGRVFYKLGDFGVARSMEHMTGGLSTKGTPNYMAPEVAYGQPYDARADIYSLGITMYRLLNGNRLPFVKEGDDSATSRQAAFSKRLSGAPLPPPENASADTASVVLRACAPNPANRYASATELRKDLEALLDGRKPVTILDDEPTVALPQARQTPASYVVPAPVSNKTSSPSLSQLNRSPDIRAPYTIPAPGGYESSSPSLNQRNRSPDSIAQYAIPLDQLNRNSNSGLRKRSASRPSLYGPPDFSIMHFDDEERQRVQDQLNRSPDSGLRERPVSRPTLDSSPQRTYMNLEDEKQQRAQEYLLRVRDREKLREAAKSRIAKRKRIRGIVLAFLALLAVVGAFFVVTKVIIPEKKWAPYKTVGNTVTFGTYPQTSSGTDQTAIEWIVLEVQGNKALLISKYGLDAKPYNTEFTNVTWETCTLRTWLNNDFCNKAFSTAEKGAILTTTVDNSSSQGCSEWHTNGGNNTQDMVFLLSYAEANKYFCAQLFSETESDNKQDSLLAPTAYAIKQGAATSSTYETTEGKAVGWWWLRSPGTNQHDAALVYETGSLLYELVEAEGCSIRPALWINLESDYFD